jgi:uncharacterized protein
MQVAVDVPSSEPTAGPVLGTERIPSMDVLRGVAVLGILLMNIPGFALPFVASFDPSVVGGHTGINLWVWATNAVLFEGKMRAIFSMLFGAGMLVLTSRLEQRGAAGDAADVYYRRLLWLLAFGLVHAYFVWWGDILFFYSVLGLFLFPLRRLSARTLVVAGLVLLLIGAGRNLLGAVDMRAMRADAQAADAAAASGAVLTKEQKDAQAAWTGRLGEAKPSAEALAEETAAYRGSYLDALRQRAGFLAVMQAPVLYHFFFFDIGGMMLLGLGLLKLGVFSAQLPARTYWTMAAVGFAVGIPIAAMAARNDIASGFDPVTAGFSSASFAVARIPIAVAHVALVMLVCKAAALRWLTAPFAAVGQTAFSCYIVESLICTTIFYGYGFGLFGRLQRYQLYYVVAAVWIVLLIAAPIWLSRFRFGPLAWLWRSLTYGSAQPMRVRREAQVDHPAVV